MAAVLILITLIKVSKGLGGIWKVTKAKVKEKEKPRTYISNLIILNYSLKKGRGNKEIGKGGDKYLKVLSPKE